MRNRLNKLYHGSYEKLAGQIETYATSNITLIHDHIVCILERKNTAPFKNTAEKRLRMRVFFNSLRVNLSLMKAMICLFRLCVWIFERFRAKFFRSEDKIGLHCFYKGRFLFQTF